MEIFSLNCPIKNLLRLSVTNLTDKLISGGGVPSGITAAIFHAMLWLAAFYVVGGELVIMVEGGERLEFKEGA